MVDVNVKNKVFCYENVMLIFFFRSCIAAALSFHTPLKRHDAQERRSRMDKYDDTTHKSTCSLTLRQLKQKKPAGGEKTFGFDNDRLLVEVGTYLLEIHKTARTRPNKPAVHVRGRSLGGTQRAVSAATRRDSAHCPRGAPRTDRWDSLPVRGNTVEKTR